MEGWVDPGYPAMHRPGVELVSSRSQVRRPNHYTTELPWSPHSLNFSNEYIPNCSNLSSCVTWLLLLVLYFGSMLAEEDSTSNPLHVNRLGMHKRTDRQTYEQARNVVPSAVLCGVETWKETTKLPEESEVNHTGVTKQSMMMECWCVCYAVQAGRSLYSIRSISLGLGLRDTDAGCWTMVTTYSVHVAGRQRFLDTAHLLRHWSVHLRCSCWEALGLSQSTFRQWGVSVV